LIANLGKTDQIPTLPAAVARLIALYGTDEYRIAQVVEVIEHDPAISTRLLRLANSPFFCFAGEVRSLKSAVLLLGGATVQGLALGSALLNPWVAAMAPEAVRSIGARKLALIDPQPGLSDPETLFTAALLHDIGKLLLLGKKPQAYAQVLESARSAEELATLELSLFGETHEEAGFGALITWKMPPAVAALAGARGIGDLRAERRPDYEIFLLTHDAALEGDLNELEETQVASSVERMRQTIFLNRKAAEEFFSSLLGR